MLQNRSKSHFSPITLATLSILGWTNTFGCASIQKDANNAADQSISTEQSTPLLDGEFTEWTKPNQAFADERYIYLRFTPSSKDLLTIQAAPISTRIRIDADQSPKTGKPMRWMSVDASIQEPQGVDLLIELSPIDNEGQIGIGSQTSIYPQNAEARTIQHADIGFSFLPTYSSPTFEARIDRLAKKSAPLQHDGLVDIIVDQVDENNRFLWSHTFTVDLPPIAQKKTQGSPVKIPLKPTEGVRIMSANVLYSAPLRHPEAFSRVNDAIDPDIILYQEWFKAEEHEVKQWVSTHLGEHWTLHLPSTKAGIGIATKLPIMTTYDAVIPSARADRPSRAAAALIDTPAGEVLAISIHLKCCGSAGSTEDQRRIQQALAINAFVHEARNDHPNASVIIAGDFNLVGSRDPLEIMSQGLAQNNQPLVPVECIQLGDPSTITWLDEKNRFSPGRLDWILIDDSRTYPEHAFILNTRTFDDASLKSNDLNRNDSKASDHLPMVVDIIKAN